ncbi:MAG: TolC family protein [Verrucomicrobiota bacterium]
MKKWFTYSSVVGLAILVYGYAQTQTTPTQESSFAPALSSPSQEHTQSLPPQTAETPGTISAPWKPVETPSIIEDVSENLPTLSFQEAWQNIQAHYPALRKQHFRLEEAIARHDQAIAGLLPRLHGKLGWTRSDDPTKVFMSKLQQEAFTNDDFLIPNLNHPSARSDYASVLRLEIPIFDGFQTISAIRATEHILSSRESEKRFSRMEASLLAIESYLNSALADRLAQFSDEVLKASEADLRDAVSLKDQGFVLGADFFAGKVISAFISQMRNALAARQRIARIYLSILQGKAIKNEYRVAAQFSSVDAPSKEMDQWIHDALLFRSDLAALHEAVYAQEAQVEQEGTKILPRISAFGERAWHTQNWDRDGENYAVGIQGTMDIFDPAYLPRIAASEAALEQLKQDLVALKDTITQTVSEASIQRQTYLRDLVLLEQAAKDAREAVDSAEKLYKEGRKSIADLQEMRQMLLSAEIAFRDTQVKAELARCRLLFLSGQLDDVEVRKIAERLNP